MKLYLRCYNKMKPVLRFINFERLNCEILRTLYDVYTLCPKKNCGPELWR